MRRKRRTIKIAVNKDKYVPKELQDIVELWIYRIIFKLNTQNVFLDNRGYFDRDYIATYLGFGEYVDDSIDLEKRDEIFQKMYEKYQLLENKKVFKTNKILYKNLNELSKIMNLNDYEKRILEFFIITYNVEILLDSLDLLGDKLNSLQVKKILSELLNIPLKEVTKAFNSNSKLTTSSLLSIEKRGTNSFNRKFDVLDDFFDDMFNKDESILVMLQSRVKQVDAGTLSLKDYTHIKKDIDILIPYLKEVIKKRKKGVNILFYGLPGTGKTELAKTIAKILKVSLFEVSYTDEDGEAIDGDKRVKAYKIAQSLLSNQKTILMYDEAEDIFESSNRDLFGIFSISKRQRDKAWINKMLESNDIPTIWITNDINSIDRAIVRRFDLSIEFPIPPKNKRVQILKKYTNNLISDETIEIIAKNENIAPALISSAIKVINTMQSNGDDVDSIFTKILENSLKAQGYHHKIVDTFSLPKNYDLKFINSSVNLEELVEGIKEHPEARLCLYGPAGTGKSAFGKYIAEILNKPYILKKVSELQSKWVGECEKNIAKAFEEAKEDNAVLIFDEVDTFLQERENASAEWQISQVNEMLVQMENFQGVFIATTNLMDNLDKASLRRFDLKIEFSYLKKSQRVELFNSFLKELNLKKVDITKIEKLEYLTAGDFATIIRQNRFRPIKSAEDFMNRLISEVKLKKESRLNKVVGFV